MSKLVEGVRAKAAKLEGKAAADYVRGEREKIAEGVKADRLVVKELTALINELDPPKDRSGRGRRPEFIIAKRKG